MNQTWINLFCPHELSTHHFKSAKVVFTMLWVSCISSHVIFHGEPNAVWISSSYSFSSGISSPVSSSLSHNKQQPEQYGHGHNSWKNPTCIIILGICNIIVIIIIKMPVVAYQNGIKLMDHVPYHTVGPWGLLTLIPKEFFFLNVHYIWNNGL